ncbi:heme ABC exporter ATP-binding protein CcmA [Fontimonas sp. SYSU GA230001]|uniref:heme ABC exporter ATP-binding protein CcmA n=1 Tax=Fontimonas sp. SYSU GA230001 TaxID=3142450 RepID=UPI0032B5E907
MHRLQINQLCVNRGDRVLLSDLSFALCAGELLHLRGANGTGKTTLLEVLAGLRRAGSGRIATEPAELGRHWIGHRNALSPPLSAVENLQFWCGLNGADASGVGPALDRLGVPSGARRRPVRTLSAGQKRRSALARLLLAPRPMWLLDEPLDGLDGGGIALFADLLAAHLRSGGMVVMTSHQALPAGLPGVRALDLQGMRRPGRRT